MPNALLREKNWLCVNGTGEKVELIARETKAMDVIDACLTLKGLKIIYELNSAMLDRDAIH